MYILREKLILYFQENIVGSCHTFFCTVVKQIHLVKIIPRKHFKNMTQKKHRHDKRLENCDWKITNNVK